MKSQNHFDLVIKSHLKCLHSDIQIGTTIASMQFNCKVKTENIVSFCTAMISTNVNRYYIIRSILLIVRHHYKVHREEILHVVTWLVNEKLWKHNKNSTLQLIWSNIETGAIRLHFASFINPAQKLVWNLFKIDLQKIEQCFII